MALGLLILLFFVFLIDLVIYAGIRRIFNLSKKPKAQKIVSIGFWLFTVFFGLFAITFIILEKNSSKPDYIIYRGYFELTGAFLLIYLPKFILAIFIIIEFILRYFVFFLSKILLIEFRLNRYKSKIFQISTIRFFGKLQSMKFLTKAGLGISILMIFVVLQGIIIGRTDYTVEHISIHFKNLPESFDGVRIAQISDMHLGSFSDPKDIRKGIDLLMKEKPDIIVFTGDMINNQSEEALIMLPELKKMHAHLGMFSILGNHDVGDYRRWKTIGEKTENLNTLKKIEEEAGFKLLLNENIIVKKNNDSIAIIGVNNWGKPPFRKYGDLKKAIKGVENVSFRLLLTHNPTHWDAEVAGKNNADLTLSGHTHAMQFGINCCGIFWCPLMWMYQHWAGLYNEGYQYLYVNRGFGYIGFPGRVSMTPEITIIELKKQK